MARQVEIITHLWCDPCLDETPDGEEPRYVEAVREVNLGFGPVGKKELKARVLAVCELHDKEVVLPLEAWYQTLAQDDPEKRKTATSAPTPKPVTRVRAPENIGDPCLVCQALGVDPVPRPSTLNAQKQHNVKFHRLGQTGYTRIAEGRYVVKGENEDGTLVIDFRGEEGEITKCPSCPAEWDERLFDSPTRLLTAHTTREHKAS